MVGDPREKPQAGGEERLFAPPDYPGVLAGMAWESRVTGKDHRLSVDCHHSGRQVPLRGRREADPSRDGGRAASLMEMTGARSI